MTPRTYVSPDAFKQALEQRLRSSARTGAEFARRRQLLVFDRFLARIVAVLGDAAMLKGGLVLELRLDRARTTKDVDLRMVGSPEDVLAKLQEAGRKNLGDFMAFEIGPDDDHPELQNDGITGSRSASMWRSAIRSSASPRSWSRRTCSRLPASPRRR